MIEKSQNRAVKNLDKLGALNPNRSIMYTFRQSEYELKNSVEFKTYDSDSSEVKNYRNETKFCHYKIIHTCVYYTYIAYTLMKSCRRLLN